MAAPSITESRSMEPSLSKYPQSQKQCRHGGSASGFEATIPSGIKPVDLRLLVKPGDAIAIARNKELDFHNIILLCSVIQSIRAWQTPYGQLGSTIISHV